jgi:hypothetical protein
MVSLALSSATSLRVAAAWGTTVVRVVDLAPGQSCVLGDAAGAFLPMPDDLFASNTPVRGVSGGWEIDPLGATGGVMKLGGIEQDPTRIAAGDAVRLRLGDFGLLQYGAFSIFFQLGRKGPPLIETRRSETLVVLTMLVSLALHAAVFAAAILLTSPELAKPAELTGRDELAARYGVRPEFIRPTPGPWPAGAAGAQGAEQSHGGPGAAPAADLQADLARALGMIKSVAPASGGRKVPDAPKAAAAGGGAAGRRVIASAVAGTAQGGLSKEKVKHLVTTHVAPLQICYENEVQRVANLQGEVSLAWQIAPDGSVTSATVSRSSLGLAKAESCMLRQVKEWQFPPSAAATNVVWSFGFALGD